MVRGVKKRVQKSSYSTHDFKRFTDFEREIRNLSDHEIKELLMINMYKMALLRSQLESLTNIMIKKKIATYEDIWKETHEHFKDSI